MDLELLRYPVGKFTDPGSFNPLKIKGFIDNIEKFPSAISSEVMSLSEEQLDTPYRPDGWTVRQVVHHVADSHINSYCRFKLAMTEDNPTIKPYLEERWAETPDGKTANITISLNLLSALHVRWVMFMRTFKDEDYSRTFHHPQHNKDLSLWYALALYDWHCRHHLAHITSLKKRNNWK